MSMEFDKRPQRRLVDQVNASKSEKQQGRFLLWDYSRSWSRAQTRFLEDLILS